MKQYMADRYARRLEEAIKQLGGVCAVQGCGVREELEIDHIEPSKKKFTITQRLAGISEAKLQAELKKCQLLCKKHHMEKTVVKDRGQTFARGTHGTHSALRYCKPRCSVCNKFYSNYQKERRKRMKTTDDKTTPG